MDKKKTNDTDWWRKALGDSPEDYRHTPEYKRRYSEWSKKRDLAERDDLPFNDPEPQTIEHLKQEIRNRKNAYTGGDGNIKKEPWMNSRDEMDRHYLNDYYQASARELESLLEELGGSLYKDSLEKPKNKGETPDQEDGRGKHFTGETIIPERKFFQIIDEWPHKLNPKRVNSRLVEKLTKEHQVDGKKRYLVGYKMKDFEKQENPQSLSKVSEPTIRRRVKAYLDPENKLYHYLNSL